MFKIYHCTVAMYLGNCQVSYVDRRCLHISMQKNTGAKRSFYVGSIDLSIVGSNLAVYFLSIVHALAPISHPIELFEIWFQKNTNTVLIYWWNVSRLKLSSGISIFINRCSDDDRPVGNSHGQNLSSGLEYQSSLFVTLVVIVRMEIPVTVLVRNIDCRYPLLRWWSSLMEISMPVVSVIYLSIHYYSLIGTGLLLNI
ncbi:hypothetical protein DERF_009863 [Dermatophagoides farinae]|uniref:Uncharacterized protein n=1 Tax=Dermatophagoides farinae TaxID=6954 RepID=A0A922I010_DERFA|nr:hypothetical protein DERF_009863 [Dermatophagoides farinae]